MMLAKEAAAPPQTNGSAIFATEEDCFELMILSSQLLVRNGNRL
jgi:hypothetical protein